MHDDLQRLIPRHILQAQGEGAADAVGEDDVLAGNIGQDLEQRAGFHILEIEGYRLSPAKAAHCTARLIPASGWAERHGEDSVGLIGHRLGIWRSADGQHRIGAYLAGLDGVDRGGEVLHIHALTQGFRQLCPAQRDHGVFTALGHVHAGLGIIQLDHEPAFPLFTAAEIQTLNAVACRGGCRSPLLWRSKGGGNDMIIQGDQDAVAIHLELVLRQVGQFDDDTGAPACFDHLHRLRQADAHGMGALGGVIDHLGQVQRDATGYAGRENPWLRRRA